MRRKPVSSKKRMAARPVGCSPSFGGRAQRLAEALDLGAAEPSFTRRAGEPADALGGIALDLADAHRMLEDRVQRREGPRGTPSPPVVAPPRLPTRAPSTVLPAAMSA